MSQDLLLKAERRTTLGTVETQRLRSAGRVPANIYGMGKPGVSASVCGDAIGKLVATLSSVVDVEVDGAIDKAVVQELQWDVFSTKVMHVDLRARRPQWTSHSRCGTRTARRGRRFERRRSSAAIAENGKN